MTHSTADFWKEQWQKTIDNSPVQRRRQNGKPDNFSRWNRMAPDFAQRTSGQEQMRHRTEIIDKMRTQGILHVNDTVLDIGAGPGSWSLPLAENSSRVTALEPADGMVDILQERIADKEVENIEIERRTWQSVDLDQEGWRGEFDLVFASMTPGIDGPEALEKMMAASRGSCYLSAFSGPGMHQQYADLWQIFFNEPMGEPVNDIIYPFNLVYAMGYRPSLEFHRWNKETVMSHDQAVDRFVQFFETHMDMTKTSKAIISEYIDTKCVDGQYARPANICRGIMMWSVQERTAAAA